MVLTEPRPDVCNPTADSCKHVLLANGTIAPAVSELPAMCLRASAVLLGSNSEWAVAMPDLCPLLAMRGMHQPCLRTLRCGKQSFSHDLTIISTVNTGVFHAIVR